MQTRKRKHLVEMTPVMLQVKENNKILGKLPAFLDRKTWTKKDWANWEESWNKVVRRRPDPKVVDKIIFAKVKREKQLKIIRGALKQERKIAKAEQRARRLNRKRQRAEHDEQVIKALRRGLDTVGKLRKATGLEAKSVRQALKRLVGSNVVIKDSPRRYKARRVRKHLPGF